MHPIQTRSFGVRNRDQVTRCVALTVVLVASWLTTAAAAVAATAADDEPRAIFVMRRDGTEVRNVVRLQDFKWLGNPCWSHDGKSLAFDAKGNGKPRLFTLDTDGNNLIDLSEGAFPSWSPDDKQLAFQLFAETNPPAEITAGVWVQNVDGKGRVRLL